VTTWELIAIALAGGAAGFINTVAGSGTLVTFPTLLAFGVPPVTANVSNNIGLVPGSVSGAIGWRRELRGQGPRVTRLASASLLGGTAGALLLLWWPEAFGVVVPVLVGLGILLVAFGPWINRRVAARAGHGDEEPKDRPWLWPAVAGTGVYGGYFGAAQGILLMAALGLGTTDTLHRDNALKNVLAGIVNAIAAVVFILISDQVDWVIVALIGVGTVVGAQLGARVGRRMPAALLRGFIIVVGVTALAVFMAR
jgi:uncharacterized membrane protein YfcA